MEIKPPYLRINQQNLKDLENAFPYLKVPKAKAGRKPKLTDIHIAAIFILYYITNTKVLTLAQLLIDLLCKQSLEIAGVLLHQRQKARSS